ncbi:universal stress protein [Actinomadura madurae]|uniref:universal stress protein n=1 Tax=Actinomadura madurae TaxID=1993 RepID=UPI0020D259EC|nr:universal stress protein [Actinomadura madurae]MCP9982674.1 universal stress protein [Actinomadura madurae]
MSETIVVATDGSEASDRALDWAAADAVLRRRPLHIVHAVESWPYKAPLFAPPEIVEQTTQAGHGVLVAAVERVHERWPDLVATTALVAEETSRPCGSSRRTRSSWCWAAAAGAASPACCWDRRA